MELVALVRAAAAGEQVPMPLDDVFASLEAEEVHPDVLLLSQLTPREREILQVLAERNSTTEVAARLGISRLTVQSHVKSILAKLGVHSKIEAVGFALRHGIVRIPGLVENDRRDRGERLMLKREYES